MHSFLKRAGILAVIFVAAVFVFSKTLNHESKDMTADMEAASLPIVYMMKDGTRLSELHGYVSEMNMATMGETITPLPDTNQLEVQVDLYGRALDELSYEVRSLDGTRLILSGDQIPFEWEADVATAQLSLQDLLREETEYLLILRLDQDGGERFYYTKLQKEAGCDTDACVDFVTEFHEKTLDSEQASDLGMFLEPSADADNGTLHSVTIQNRLRQISWGKLEVTELTKPVVAVQEMNRDYNEILLQTTVNAPNENGTVDYYNVKEYYRVRQGIARMYLLDYERTVEEIYQGSKDSLKGNYLQLGIRSEDVDYWSSETGTNVCFVQEGELWNYNQSSNQLVQVYSFRSDDFSDARENYDQHDIRIIHADETGGIDFIVYGYMNRGAHEGQVGISVCHYDSVTNTVEEYLFLPTTVSYAVLQQSIDQLLYINDDRMFYLMLGDGVFEINLDTKEYKEILDDLIDGCCQVSDDGRYLAWVDPKVMNTAVCMNLMDLKTGEIYQMNAPDGTYIKPLGFVEADCVYGLSGKNAGSFLTEQIVIGEVKQQGLETLTEYHKPGYWVSNVSIESGVVRLQLAQTGTTEIVAEDTITNKEIQESLRAQVETYSSELKQTQVRFVLAETAEEKAPVIKTPKLLLSETSTILKLDAEIFVR